MMELPRYYPLIAYVPLAELLVCAFNAILFVLVSFYCIRDYHRRKTKWGAYTYAYAVVVCAVIFIGHLGNDFASEFTYQRYRFFDVMEISAKYLLAPLVVHLFYGNEKEHLRGRKIWLVALALVYAAAIVSCAAELNAGVIGAWRGWPGWGVVRILFRGVMTLAAMNSAVVIWTARPAQATALYDKRRRGFYMDAGSGQRPSQQGDFYRRDGTRFSGNLYPSCSFLSLLIMRSDLRFSIF